MQVPWDMVKGRDERFGVNTEKKRERRRVIEPHQVHGDADSCWEK
jgi:hypothetical protein